MAPLHRVLANRDNFEGALFSALLLEPNAGDVEPLSTLGTPVYDKLNSEYRRRRVSIVVAVLRAISLTLARKLKSRITATKTLP